MAQDGSHSQKPQGMECGRCHPAGVSIRPHSARSCRARAKSNQKPSKKVPPGDYPRRGRRRSSVAPPSNILKVFQKPMIFHRFLYIFALEPLSCIIDLLSSPSSRTRWPKTAQDGPKMLQDGPKTPPRPPKMAPRRLKINPQTFKNLWFSLGF